MHFPWSLRRCHQYCVTWIDAMTMKSPPEWKVDTLKKADQNWKLYQPNVKSNKEKSTQKGSLCKLKDNVYPKIGKKMWKNKFYIKICIIILAPMACHMILVIYFQYRESFIMTRLMKLWWILLCWILSPCNTHLHPAAASVTEKAGALGEVPSYCHCL